MRTMTVTGLAAIALAGVATGCSPDKGYHPEADVPETHARAHKPEYREGEVDRSELEPADPQEKVERGDPPSQVGAAWSDPSGDPEDITVTAIVLDPILAEACQIQDKEAYFAYDSAKLDPMSKKVFAAVADCFDEGPLAGHSLEVVGHTDPRGSDQYNRELGESRAESVAKVLTKHGVPESKVSVATRGEALAHSEPEKWPLARRVELHLGS